MFLRSRSWAVPSTMAFLLALAAAGCGGATTSGPPPTTPEAEQARMAHHAGVSAHQGAAAAHSYVHSQQNPKPAGQ